MAHSEHSHNGFIVGAVVGSVLGAMATMLFTTNQGRKIQHEAVEKYHDFEKMAKNLVHSRAKKINRHKKRHKN